MNEIQSDIWIKHYAITHDAIILMDRIKACIELLFFTTDLSSRVSFKNSPFHHFFWQCTFQTCTVLIMVLFFSVCPQSLGEVQRENELAVRRGSQTGCTRMILLTSEIYLIYNPLSVL